MDLRNEPAVSEQDDSVPDRTETEDTKEDN